MEAIKLRDGFCWTGIIDDKLRVFDIVMYTEFGTTYNSYVMKTGDKVVLFETAKARFFDDYLEKLKDVIDVTKIDYQPHGAGPCGECGAAAGLQSPDEDTGHSLCH